MKTMFEFYLNYFKFIYLYNKIMNNISKVKNERGIK